MAPTLAAFYEDPNREDIFLFEIGAYVRATGATVTLRLSTAEFATEPGDTPPNEPYLPVVLNGFSFLAPPVEAEAVGLAPYADGVIVELGNRFGELDSWRETYALAGRFVTIKHGGSYVGGRLSYSQYRVVKVAQIEEALFGLNIVRLKLTEQTKRFESAVEDRVLRGGTTALGFDGSANYVDFGAGSGSKFAGIVNDMALEAWVYVESLAAARTIISAGASTNRPFHLEIATSGQLAARWSKGAAAKSATTTTLTALVVKQWHFVAMSIASTTITFHIYAFRTNAWDSETYTHADVAGRNTQTASNVYIGRTVGGTAYFNGQIDELRLWNDDRSEETIREQHNRQLVTSSEVLGVTALKLYCKMDDASGATVKDSSDSPVNGTLASFLTALTGPGVAIASHYPGSSDKNCFTRTSGSFIADGWAIGDKGLSAGWLGTSLSNNGNFTVGPAGEAVTALRLPIDHASLVLTRQSGDGTSSAITLSRYGASQAWYPSLTGGVPDQDDDEPDNDQREVPNVFGIVQGWAPLLVDPVRGIYQLHVCEIDTLADVMEGGSTILLNAAFTDLKTFLDAAPVLGTYDVLLSPCGSYVRIGSPVSEFPITVNLIGDDFYGTGAETTVAGIWRQIITTRGAQPLADPAEIDTAAFTAHDTATDNAPVGIVIEGGKQILEVGRELMESTGTVAWFKRTTGKHSLLQFAGASGTVVKDTDGTTDFTLTEDDICDGTEPEPQSVTGPFWSVDVPHRRCWNTLGTADLTQDAKKSPQLWRFYQTEYRYAKAKDSAVKTEHPLAKSLARAAGLISTTKHAQAEAARVLALYRDEPQAYEITCRSRALWLDRYDTILFDYSDYDADGNLQQRIGGPAVKWIVLGVREVMENAQVVLMIWRENSTA